jgi:peptidoglycan hydrolase CwlO-like protein
MYDIILSILLIASIIFLIFELRRFSVLHSRKYELPTEKIWEKFIGIRPEDMAESNLTEKVQSLDRRINDIQGELEKEKKLTKKLIEELGK